VGINTTSPSVTLDVNGTIVEITIFEKEENKVFDNPN
jgi:hypothetical protein